MQRLWRRNRTAGFERSKIRPGDAKSFSGKGRSMTSSIENKKETEIYSLLRRLGDGDGLQRYHARLSLVDIGTPAVPALIEALSDPRSIIRWEASKALQEIRDPQAAEALCGVLTDDEQDLRWAAAEALVALDRTSITPLMRRLTHDFGSLGLRTAAHHVLHELDRTGKLTESEKRVLKLLEEAVPEYQTPWAAAAVLEENLYKEVKIAPRRVSMTSQISTNA